MVSDPAVNPYATPETWFEKKLQGLVLRQHEMLKRYEAFMGGSEYSLCAECGGDMLKAEPHAHDCALAALLREVDDAG